jgi:ABC-2 type transport system ATP-binding protein
VSSPSAAIEVVDLVKRYGATTAVAGATFSAPRGGVTAVLGPNGAGKTTTIECCEGLRRPDGGTLRVLGLDPARHGAGLRPRVGVMLQDGGLPGAARVADVLRLTAALYANPHRPADLLAALGVADCARTPIRRLSGGQRQRVALAVALVGRPELVFLDEPTAGLDPQARVAAWELVRRLRADGVTIVMTTHLLDEAERLADHVVVMSGGRVVAAGTPAELTAGDDTLSFDAAPGLDLSGLIAVLPEGIRVSEARPGRYVAGAMPGTALDASTVATVTAWCADRGVVLSGLTLGRRTLEDVFHELAAREPAAGAAGSHPAEATPTREAS